MKKMLLITMMCGVVIALPAATPTPAPTPVPPTSGVVIALPAATPTPAPTPVPPTIWINLDRVVLVVPKDKGAYSVEYENDYYSVVVGNPLDEAVVSTKGGTWVKMTLAQDANP